MTIATLLQDLRARGIELDLTDGRLVSRAPRGVLTPELADAIRTQRAAIIEFLHEGHVERHMADVPPIRPVPRAEYMPVSYSQERLWYLNQVDQNPAVYNLPLSFRVVGQVQVDVLQRCLDTLEARHEALRTTVEMVNGRAMQRIHAPRGLPIVEKDLRAASVSGAPGLETLLQMEAMGSFDLSNGPLARATLIRTGEQEYYFLLVMHHVISDGLSTQIILRELVLLYESLQGGEPAVLPPLAVQFADYAVWQRGWLQGAALERQLEYWTKSLAAPLPVLEIATDFPRPPIRSANGAKVPLRLSRELVAALTRIGREEGATPFMVLMALYNAFLSRHSGQEDVIVGTPVANRTRQESAGIVGFIANTVVLRTKLDGEPSFRELVRRVRDTCVGAFRHQDMPFQKIVEVLNPPRDMSRTPVFQAFFTYHEISSQSDRMGNLELHPVVAGSNVSRMDLSLFLRELNDEVLGSLEYNTDLFARDTIVRMIGHFTTLAGSVAADPDGPVCRSPMLTADEREQLDTWNRTATDYPRVLVQDLVSAQLLLGPDRVAVQQEQTGLTYAQLDGRANRLAHTLRQLGVERGSLVGVCVDRSVDLPAILLGVLKTGAAYVPLDPAFPSARLGYMLQDAGVRVIVSERSLADRLPPGLAQVVWLEDLIALPLRDDAPECAATPDDRAYVIYTSGSTGKPKGVEVLHRNVVNFLNTMRDRPGIRSDDVVVAVTTPSFDIAVLELFLPLTVGARVEVATTSAAMDGAQLSRLLVDARATMMQATPATWRAMLDAGWTGHPSLRALCGGEGLPGDLAARLLPSVGELWNMYGPTETTVWSTCVRITDADNISIGTPVGNTTALVTDGKGQEVPVGVAGELYLGGAGVTPGYLGHAELTRMRFLDGAGTSPHARVYRTGDLVKRQADGTLVHLGRLDDQVKVQGFRIELGEIESVLRSHPHVADAVVSVHREDAGHPRLVAWVVYNEGEQPTVSEVRRYLRRELPPYMVPGIIGQLDAIPRTVNGKLNRLALPDPMRTSLTLQAFEPLATPAEHIIAEVWMSLLPVARVGRNDNFFELGGHSLLSMRAVAAIEERSGIRIDPRSFFFHTVQQIGAMLESRRTAA